MNLKKIIGFAVLAIVAVVAAAFIYLSMNYSSIVKAGVESQGPKFTKTEVVLGGVEVSPFAGEISINDFLVGNPKGFKTSHAFKVSTVKVAVDLGSLTGETIHTNEIVIDAPDIIYELGGGGSNLQTIQKNVAQASGGGKDKAAKDAKAKAGGSEGPKVIIDNLYIRNVKAALSAGMLGGKTVPVPVPDLHLKDIGKDSKDGKGATVGEATAKVMDALTGSITKAASAINLDGIKKQAEELTKGAGGAAKGVTDGLKGLFGK